MLSFPSISEMVVEEIGTKRKLIGGCFLYLDAAF